MQSPHPKIGMNGKWVVKIFSDRVKCPRLPVGSSVLWHYNYCEMMDNKTNKVHWLTDWLTVAQGRSLSHCHCNVFIYNTVRQSYSQTVTLGCEAQQKLIGDRSLYVNAKSPLTLHCGFLYLIGNALSEYFHILGRHWCSQMNVFIGF